MVAATPPAPGQPSQGAPFGQSPVTGPTPNKGFEAAAAKQVGAVVKRLSELLPMAGANSDVGKDILKALNILAKHAPSGSVSPAEERSQLERQLMNNTQNAQQGQQLKQAMAQQQAQGGQQQAAA